MPIVTPISVPRTTDPKEVRKWMEKVSGLFSYQTYEGVPTNNIVPRWAGDRCLDITNNEWYHSIGTAASTWAIIT